MRNPTARNVKCSVVADKKHPHKALKCIRFEQGKSVSTDGYVLIEVPYTGSTTTGNKLKEPIHLNKESLIKLIKSVKGKRNKDLQLTIKETGGSNISVECEDKILLTESVSDYPQIDAIWPEGDIKYKTAFTLSVF